MSSYGQFFFRENKMSSNNIDSVTFVGISNKYFQCNKLNFRLWKNISGQTDVINYSKSTNYRNFLLNPIYLYDKYQSYIKVLYYVNVIQVVSKRFYRIRGVILFTETNNIYYGT